MTDASQNGNQAFDDEEWLILTEDMEPYERFRYIVRHVLQAAIDDASDYAADERIFGDDVSVSLESHLEELDERLQADEEISEVEAMFMCSAVDAAMREEGLRSRCYSELFDGARAADPTCRDRS